MLELATDGGWVESAPGLVLLVGAARSGTTLTRLILDAHSEIGCPAEAAIPSLIQTLSRVWWTIEADHADGSETFADLAVDVKDEIRRAAVAPMRHYCVQAGKRVYCDKSLDSVHHLGPVRELFPDARYVLLFRHVMDTVASGLEASPWGFQAYGYLPFVQSSPDNFVAGLVNYWLVHVDKALQWEEAHADVCHRVRYEDLVMEPKDTVTRMFAFLGVELDLSVLERAFDKARVANGPGDHKIGFTSGVHAASVGHGKRVPIAMIPPPLLAATNDKLVALGYEPLDRAWNSAPVCRPGEARSRSPWNQSLTELMSTAVIAQPLTNRAEQGSFAVVAEDEEDMRWVIDTTAGEIRQGDGEVDSVVTGTVEDLVLMIRGDVNPAVLLRSGRIRHLTAREGVSPGEVAQAMNGVLNVLRSSAAPASASKHVGVG